MKLSKAAFTFFVVLLANSATQENSIPVGIENNKSVNFSDIHTDQIADTLVLSGALSQPDSDFTPNLSTKVHLVIKDKNGNKIADIPAAQHIHRESKHQKNHVTYMADVPYQLNDGEVLTLQYKA